MLFMLYTLITYIPEAREEAIDFKLLFAPMVKYRHHDKRTYCNATPPNHVAMFTRGVWGSNVFFKLRNISTKAAKAAKKPKGGQVSDMTVPLAAL